MSEGSPLCDLCSCAICLTLYPKQQWGVTKNTDSNILLLSSVLPNSLKYLISFLWNHFDSLAVNNHRDFQQMMFL